jgi:L-methionine (R)-S-oxide reductase
MQERQSWLETFLARHGGVAGTIHVLRDQRLALEAAANIPEAVQALVREVPRGKGMAGLAWERDAPVQTCNLQSDASGDVRPGARAVSAQAAVALPVHDAHGALRAVVGIAFAGEREIPPSELARLSDAAAQVP